MTGAQRAALAALAATFTASAVAIPTIAKWEGWRNDAYSDPILIATACVGATQGVKAGKTYTDTECRDLLARDVISHGLAIAPCLPENLPVETRAAFVSMAFNIGPKAFCSSTLSKKARAGDLRGACAEISRWTMAGGRQLLGLVRRRADERALCEQGLAA